MSWHFKEDRIRAFMSALFKYLNGSPDSQEPNFKGTRRVFDLRPARNYSVESPNTRDLSLAREIRTFYELSEVMPFSSFVSLYYLCEQTVNLQNTLRTLSRA